jgi:hypothetical protein
MIPVLAATTKAKLIFISFIRVSEFSTSAFADELGLRRARMRGNF